MPSTADERPILTVSALAREARVLIEQHFHIVWVAGELSNFRRPGSGHWYFTLKDDSAQIRCAMFAGRNRTLRFEPREGMEVMVRGRLSLYEARGDFQLIAEHMEAAGEGALRAAFEALKSKLDAEGLFDAAAKRPLPALPRHLAVISSASGAALRDVLHVIERRFPALRVTLIPVAVQGERAEPEILQALARVADLKPDVVLLTRGGGSLEDLWAFNLETVARAVAACPVPVVSAVGHQTDFTITDFAADLRAPTPSAGAELLTPDRQELDRRVWHLEQRLRRAFMANLSARKQRVGHLRALLNDPGRRLQQQMQRADELEERLRRGISQRLGEARSSVRVLARGLHLLRPERRIQQQQVDVQNLFGALLAASQHSLQTRRSALTNAARTLQAVSPLATLSRGYAVLRPPAEGASGTAGKPVTSIRETAADAVLLAHLKDGALSVRVMSIDEDNQLPALPRLDLD